MMKAAGTMAFLQHPGARWIEKIDPKHNQTHRTHTYIHAWTPVLSFDLSFGPKKLFLAQKVRVRPARERE